LAIKQIKVLIGAVNFSQGQSKKKQQASQEISIGRRPGNRNNSYYSLAVIKSNLMCLLNNSPISSSAVNRHLRLLASENGFYPIAPKIKIYWHRSIWTTPHFHIKGRWPTKNS